MEDWNKKLFEAAENGRVEELKLCLANGANIDYQRDGKTALHLAAEYGSLHVTRCLVEEGGISPFVKTHEGKTPYDLAAAMKCWQYKEVMEYLQTVMSEKSSGVTAGLGIEDSIRSAMLNKLLGSGSYESFDMRCMVTGQFSVGKSSLVKLLVGDNVPEGRHATDGITLIEGRCGLDIETRNWIMIDPATYNALDVVYNKVLMTSIEEDESKQAKTPENQEPDAKPVDSQHAEDNPSQKSQATKSTSWPVNDSSEPSTQPQTAQSLSPQTSSSESKKQQMKKKMTTKMTKKEIRKRMEKVLKSGKYKMKVGRLIFWDFGGQYVYYTTHQTFMTYRALFLVVFDGSKRLNEEVPDVLCFPGQHMTPTPAVFLLHWVNSILTYCKVVYAGIPRILFVATHKDKIPV
ncbi:Hypothetical predicted protein, partial [Mytilus galloprovincialis]